MNKMPAIAVPTINPITGKKFSSKEDREQFVSEQEERRKKTLEQRKERVQQREVAKQKIISLFEQYDITAEEVNLIFGARIL